MKSLMMDWLSFVPVENSIVFLIPGNTVEIHAIGVIVNVITFTRCAMLAGA